MILLISFWQGDSAKLQIPTNQYLRRCLIVFRYKLIKRNVIKSFCPRQRTIRLYNYILFGTVFYHVFTVTKWAPFNLIDGRDFAACFNEFLNQLSRVIAYPNIECQALFFGPN